MNSMLPCGCSVINHRKCQCGNNISDTLGYYLMRCATFLFLPHFDAICIYYWTDSQQHGIYLLNINVAEYIKAQIMYVYY